MKRTTNIYFDNNTNTELHTISGMKVFTQKLKIVHNKQGKQPIHNISV